MTASALDRVSEQNEALKMAFLRWQCRVRQLSMREASGKPDDAMMPSLTLAGAKEPMGTIISQLIKSEPHSLLPEIQHIAQRTKDPAEMRTKAVQYFSETYFQKPREFSDQLTATFQPGSEGAEAILAAGSCRLDFDAYSQSFSLMCHAQKLDKNHYFFKTTWWYHKLFNPGLRPDVEVLCFSPNWAECEGSS